MVLEERIKGMLTYIAKCVAGVLSIFLISKLISYDDIGWALISVILVLSPDGKDSVALAVTRIKANIIGAAVGVLCLLIGAPTMWTISLATAVTLVVCYLLKLDAVVRSALAAAVIVMLHESGKHLWDTALERVLAVLAGCLLGLIITFVFHFKTSSEKQMGTPQQGE